MEVAFLIRIEISKRTRSKNMANAKRMELTIIDPNNLTCDIDHIVEILERKDYIVLVDPKSVKDYEFVFDEYSEYNKTDYDYDQALMSIFMESAQ